MFFHHALQWSLPDPSGGNVSIPGARPNGRTRNRTNPGKLEGHLEPDDGWIPSSELGQRP